MTPLRPSPQSMRRPHAAVLAALALLAATVAGCASLIGPRQIEVPAARLQQSLERRFPLHNRVLELLDIELSRPQLTLVPGQDRVALTMDASVSPPFLKQSWSGSMTFSGRLAVDAARGAVFINDARIDSVHVDGVDEARQRQFAKVANLTMDKLVRDVPIYSFRPEDLRYGGVQFTPTRIATSANALVVTVEPAR